MSTPATGLPRNCECQVSQHYRLLFEWSLAVAACAIGTSTSSVRSDADDININIVNVGIIYRCQSNQQCLMGNQTLLTNNVHKRNYACRSDPCRIRCVPFGFPPLVYRLILFTRTLYILVWDAVTHKLYANVYRKHSSFTICRLSLWLRLTGSWPAE